MSWFLFGSGKKKPSKRKAAKQPKAKKWDPVATYRVVQAGLIAALAVALGTGWAIGQRPLKKSIAGSIKSPVSVKLIDTPAWMPAELTEELRGMVADRVSADPFDRASLQAAAGELRGSPWVQRVARVSRHSGGVVEVAAEYRQRAALVNSGAGYHLVDTRGVRLPFSYSATEAGQTGLPLIQGVATATPPPGQAWAGDDIAAALKLASCIARESWVGQVKAIDVSNHAGRRDASRGHLKLLTALDGDADPSNNPGVEWGRTPGEEQPFEPSAAWKLQRIGREIRKFGPLRDRVVSVTQEPGLTSRIPSEEETFVNATDRRSGNAQ